MELTLTLEQTPKQRNILNSMRLRGECCDARIVSCSDFVGTESFSLGVHCCVLFAASPLLYERFTILTRQHRKKDMKYRYRISSPGVSLEVWFLVLDYIYLGTVTFSESSPFQVISSFASVVNSLKIVGDSELERIKKHLISHPVHEELVEAAKDPLETFNKVVRVFMGPEKDKVCVEKKKVPKFYDLESKKEKKVKKLRLRNLKKLHQAELKKSHKITSRHACNTCGKSFFMAQTLENHQCETLNECTPKKKEYVMPEELFVNSRGAFISPPTFATGTSNVTKQSSFASVGESEMDDLNRENGETAENKKEIISIKEEPIAENCTEPDHSPNRITELECFGASKRTFDAQGCVPITIAPIEQDGDGAILSSKDIQRGIDVLELAQESTENQFGNSEANSVKGQNTSDSAALDSQIFPSMENINILLEGHRQTANSEHNSENVACETQTTNSVVLDVIDSISSDVKPPINILECSESQGQQKSPCLNVVQSIGAVEISNEKPVYSFMAADDSGEVHVKLPSSATEFQESPMDEDEVKVQGDTEENAENDLEDEKLHSYKGLIDHVQNTQPIRGASFSCPYCPRKFFMAISLLKHKCEKKYARRVADVKKYSRCLCCHKFVPSSEFEEHVFQECEKTDARKTSGLIQRKLHKSNSSYTRSLSDRRYKPIQPKETSDKDFLNSSDRNKVHQSHGKMKAADGISMSTNTRSQTPNISSKHLLSSERKSPGSSEKESVKSHTMPDGSQVIVLPPVNRSPFPHRNHPKMSKPKKVEHTNSMPKANPESPSKPASFSSEELFARLEQSVKKANFPFTKITVVNPSDLLPPSKKGNNDGEESLEKSNGHQVQNKKPQVSGMTKVSAKFLPSVSLKRLSDPLLASTAGSLVKSKNETKSDQIRSATLSKGGQSDSSDVSSQNKRVELHGIRDKYPVVLVEPLTDGKI